MTTNQLRQMSFVRAALAALVIVLVPSVASAQSRRGGGSAGHLEIGGEAGLTIPFDSGIGVGIKFAPQGFFFLPELSHGLSLGVGGQVAFDYHLGDVTFWFMDFVPMGRLRYAVSPTMAVYGDLGLGLALVHISLPTFNFGFGTIGGSDTSVGFLLKFGGGVEFKINDKMSLTAGPAFNVYAKSGATTTLSLMGGLLYKI